MNEASGNRLDSSGNGWTLAPTNVPTSVPGIIGNAADFVNTSSQSLRSSGTNFTSISQAADFSTSAWVMPKSFSGNNTVWGTTATQIVPRLQINTGATINFQVTGAAPQWGTVLVANTWYFVVTRYTAASKLAEISINGGTFVTANGTAPTTTAGDMLVGARGDLTRFIDADVDELGVWSKLLTSTEVTYLYNSGAGNTYPFTA